MSLERTTEDLIEEILQISGEMTDGTSPFDSIALNRLNSVYKSLLSGGSEFDVEMGEPFHWAQAKKPIVLELSPLVEGTVTATNGSRAITFSSGPASSLTGRFIKFSSRDDIYRIAEHTAASTSATLDQTYLDDSDTLSYKAYKLDYDLIDDTIVVDSTNNKIDFTENGTAELTATLTSGVYTPTTFATEVDTRITAAGAQSYTVTFDSVLRKFTLTSSGSVFRLYFGTGTNASKGAAALLGFDDNNQSGALTYTSSYALSGILRLSRPMTIYKDTGMIFSSAKDSGKVFMIDSNTFLREYPLNRLNEDIPSKFCIVEQSKTGIWKARFNASVPDDPIRIEVNYIPVPRKLYDNSVSVPVIPGSYTDYLIFAAAHYVLFEKSDSKADKYFALAQAKLKAMVSDNRKNKTLAGQNYGRLVPRLGSIKVFGWYRSGS